MCIYDLTLRWASETARPFQKCPFVFLSTAVWASMNMQIILPPIRPPLCRSSQNLRALCSSEPWRKTGLVKDGNFPLIWCFGSRQLNLIGLDEPMVTDTGPTGPVSLPGTVIIKVPMMIKWCVQPLQTEIINTTNSEHAPVGSCKLPWTYFPAANWSMLSWKQ